MSRIDEKHVEYSAYNVLYLFAQTELEDNVNDYKPAFQVIIFAETNIKARAIVIGSNA